MGNKENSQSKNSSSSTILHWVGKLVGTAIILSLVSFLTPGFSIHGLWSYLLAALAISALDYFAERVMKVDASPFGRGIKGFIIAAVILYVTQFLVPNMSVTLWGAVIGAVLIGLLDAILPGRVM